jgi:hypothetical protein
MVEKRSKWIIGILVTLMMVLVASVPVMAAEYTVDLSAKAGDTNSVESLPETLKEGDALMLTQDLWEEYPAKIWCQYEGAEGLSWDKYRNISDEGKTGHCVVECVNGVSEWKVRTSEKYVHPNDGESGVFICLRADKNTKYDLEWFNECKKGTVDEDYDTAYWVFRDLDKYPGYKSVSVSIHDADHIDLPKGVKVRSGADPRNGGRIGLNFYGNPTESGTFSPVIYGTVDYANDEGERKTFVFKWSFKITIEEKNNSNDDNQAHEESRDDDDDKHEEQSSSSSNDNSSSQSWTAPASAQAATPAQQAAQQLAAVRTAIASVPALLESNSAAYASTGMPLNMTNVTILDADTATLLTANNKIPYIITVTFSGAPLTVKIPAGFNYKSYIKSDGSINICEVIWDVLLNDLKKQSVNQKSLKKRSVKQNSRH